MNARVTLADFEPQIAMLRIPPHSIEAESSVLGGLLLDSAQAWDLIGDVLTESDFYRREHQLIYAAIAQLCNANKPADLVTVHDQLGAKSDEVGGLVYLNAVAQFVPSAANIRRYAEIVREKALSRGLVSVGDRIATMGFIADGSVEQRRDEAAGLLMGLMGNAAANEWSTLDETMVQLLGVINDKAEGKREDVIPTGLADLDEILSGGMRPGQMIIIGARPSQGKSALAVTIGTHVALHEGLPVGMFSLEMSAEELALRQTSMISHIHLERLRRSERLNDDDWPRLTAAVETLRQTPFYVSEMPGPNINQIRARARKLKRQRGLRLLIVDYLQLATGTNPKESRNNQLGEVSRGLKSLAKELQVPIIALAQLGRDIEKRTNSRPMLSDLRDSGDIEQDADVILFLDRPAMSNPSLGSQFEDYAEVIVGKQRNGARGTVSLRYVGKNVQFLDWEGETPSKSARHSGSAL